MGFLVKVNPHVRPMRLISNALGCYAVGYTKVGLCRFLSSSKWSVNQITDN